MIKQIYIKFRMQMFFVLAVCYVISIFMLACHKTTWTLTLAIIAAVLFAAESILVVFYNGEKL
jgi:hypothetical protein